MPLSSCRTDWTTAMRGPRRPARSGQVAQLGLTEGRRILRPRHFRYRADRHVVEADAQCMASLPPDCGLRSAFGVSIGQKRSSPTIPGPPRSRLLRCVDRGLKGAENVIRSGERILLQESAVLCPTIHDRQLSESRLAWARHNVTSVRRPSPSAAPFAGPLSVRLP
jgi:hypothetical protein